jgi:hypothetical protein
MVHSFLSIHLRYFFPQTRGTLGKINEYLRFKLKLYMHVLPRYILIIFYHPPGLDATVFGNTTWTQDIGVIF